MQSGGDSQSTLTARYLCAARNLSQTRLALSLKTWRFYSFPKGTENIQVFNSASLLLTVCLKKIINGKEKGICRTKSVDCTYSKIKATTINICMFNGRRLVKVPVATPYNKILSAVLANWRLGGGGRNSSSKPA